MSEWAADQADAVERNVVSMEWEGRPARAVVAERTYSTGVGDLWDALTDPERMKRWFMPVSGDLKPGGRFQLEGNAGGEILACEPPRRLYVTWEMRGQISWVVVTLAAAGDDAARLRLEHIGHEDAQYLGFWEQFGPGAVGVGWDLSLLGLAEYLRTGTSPEGQGNDAWLMTGEGRPFAEVTSKAWGEADAAFGTDREAAEAAAKRTFGFYTGSG